MATEFGFDIAIPPSPAQAKAILTAIGGDYVGVYIGGPRAYHTWTRADIDGYIAAGITKYLPYYVGRQVANGDNFTLGVTDGNDAVAKMKAFGWAPGSPVALDMEGNQTAPAVLSYIRDWTKTVQAAGYKAGLYSNPDTFKALLGAAAQYQPLPDFPVVAAWPYSTVNVPPGSVPAVNVKDAPVGGYSTPMRRVWQYAGGNVRVVGVPVDLLALEGVTLATIAAPADPCATIKAELVATQASLAAAQANVSALTTSLQIANGKLSVANSLILQLQAALVALQNYKL